MTRTIPLKKLILVGPSAFVLGCGQLLGANFDGLPVRPTDVEEPDAGPAGDAADGVPDRGDGDGHVPLDQRCTPSCPADGTLECDSGRQIRVCQSSDGCLHWVLLPPCNAGSICCEGTCSLTPRCGDSDDYYVDATAVSTADGSTGDGTKDHPFRTITAALRAAGAKRIHVANGTYNSDLGEVFPLVVRGASLLGGDTAKTIIEGLGYFDPALTGGIAKGPVDTALVVGDARATTLLSDLTIRVPGRRTIDNVGLVCNRGTATPSRDAASLPNTIVTRVVVDGFENGFDGLSSPPPYAGCNLKMTSSIVRSGVDGIYVPACDHPNQAPRSLDIGDETAMLGNVFELFEPWPGGPGGAGLDVGDCTTHVTVRHNTFRNSYAGISIVQYDPPANSFVVTDNKFQDLTGMGIGIFGASALVQDLSGNSFTNILAAQLRHFQGVALIIDAAGDTTAPRIVKARSNTFVGNEVGIDFRGGPPFRLASPVSDFGTRDDPGRNVFRCNSSSVSTLPGADLRVFTGGDGTVSLPFWGNTWDHAPPTSAIAESNGIDILMLSTQPPVVDANGASTSSDACPSGHAP